MADLGALQLAAQALRFRRGVSASILLVATITVGSAAVGPVFARAGAESMLRDAMRSAPVSATGIRVQKSVPPTPTALEQLDNHVAGAGQLAGYPSRLRALQLDGNVRRLDGTGKALTRFVWRPDACSHLRFSAGRCPRAAREIAVSARSAREYGWRPGTALRTEGFAGQATAAGTMTVVGLYAPADPTERYWFDLDYFDAHQNDDPPDTVDSTFVDSSTMRDAAVPGRVLVELPLDVERLRLADMPAVRAAADRLAVELHRSDAEATATTTLGALLDTAAADRKQLTVLVTIVALQLLLLGYFVLYLIVANWSEARAPELALAKLRGGRPLSTLAFGLLEPVVLLVLAAPLGLAAAVLFVEVVAHRILLGGTPVLLPLTAFLAGLGAILGGVAAAALAARRTLSRPVTEQLRRAPGDRAAGRRATAIDVAVIVLALAALLELRLSGGLSNGKVDNLALLAPGLLALAAALIGIRLLPLLGRLLVWRTRSGRDVGSFLALRQVLRRPVGLRVVVLLATALALATFAVALTSTSATNRQDRAATEVGATRVAVVGAASADQLLNAVRRLDPDGRWAMAAQQYDPYSGQPGGTLIGVDSPRLPAVATWRSDFAGSSLPALVAALHPTLPPPVMVTGRGLRVHALVTRLASPVPLHLNATLALGTDATREVDLGPLALGARDYVGRITGCEASCRLRGLTVLRPLGSFSPIAGTVVLQGLATNARDGWRALPAGLDERDRWQPVRPRDDNSGMDSLLATAVGLRYDFSALAGGDPGVSPVDAPSPLPVVTNPKPLGDARVGGAYDVTGLDGQLRTVQAAAVANVLPRIQDGGTMVDLTYASRAVRSGTADVTSEVWLGERAPADALSRIRDVGLPVVRVEAAADHRARLDRTGPALALNLFLAGAGLAALLAAAGTVASVYLTGRRRAYEVAALLAAGLSRASLLRAAVVEQLGLLLTGLTIGTAAGLGGAVLALPSVPVFTDGRAVPALRFDLHAVPLALLVLGFAVLLLTLAVVAGSALVRSAVPARLREVQQ